MATLVALAALSLAAFLTTGASASAAEGECPNAAIRAQQGSQHLPDCRAYELVVPEHQGAGTAVGPTLGPPNNGVWVAEDGNSIAYPSADGFVGPSGLSATYLSTRGAAAWSTVSLFGHFPGNLANPVLTMAMNEDRSRMVFQTNSALDPADTNGLPVGVEDVYLKDETGAITWISASVDPEPSYFQGASDDLTHIAFATRNNVVPEATGSAFKLYEWFNGTVRLVGVKPDDSVDPGGSSLGSRVEENGESSLPFDAVSDDGSRIFFRSPLPDAATPGNPSRLYVRIDGTETIEVSESKCTRIDCNAPANIVYAGAVADGSRVFFTSEQQLTNDDTDTVSDLYRYDLDTDTLTRLSAGAGADQIPQTQDSVILAMSDDGERVYFRGAPPSTPLYLSDHGTLLQLSTSLGQSTGGATQNCNNTIGLNDAGAGIPQVTPDGSVLIFAADTFESSDPEAEGLGLYRYDAGADELLKLSDLGGLPNSVIAAFFDCYKLRGLTDDGSIVFFHTNEALVPQDANGRFDIYAWHDGVYGLISSGTGERDSLVLGASRDGRDVFFTTEDRLTPGDKDGAQDIYDARVGGGYLEPSPAAPCSGEGCKGDSSPQQGSTAPASSAFVGAGNANARAKARRCAKGKRRVRRAGKTRCVRKRRKQSNRANADRRASR